MFLDIYTILPLTCALFVIFFGIFVLSKDYHSRMNQILFGFNMSMFFWMFGTFMMFAERGNATSAIFWDRFVYLGVVFMPPFMHHFSLLFTQNYKKQKPLLVINYILAFVFLILSQTRYFVDGLFYYSWGVHTQARILHTVFLGYFFIGTGLFFRNVFLYYRSVTERLKKIQSTYVFVAFALVIFIGGSAYLLAYNIDTHFPYSYVTGLIFPVMLFYAVSRHHLLGAKIIATEVLVGFAEFLMVLQIFFSQSLPDIIIRIIFAAVIALIGVLLNKSVRREIERREEVTTLAHSLEQANLQLRELDRQKTEFLSIAAHQLRTPLSILKGYISLIEEGAYGKTTKKMQEILGNMDKSNEHLVKLIDEFLNITRIEQGRTKYNFLENDINNIVNDAATELQEKARESGLKVVWKDNPLVGKTMMDSEKIRHVVYNFIDNAIKYTTKGEIKASVDKEDGGIAFRVTDKGLGFANVDQANFFQKFYRGQNVKDINVNGTGLGLYVCRKFIEAHNGKVWAKSEGLGKGSEFGFWIPEKQKI